MNDGELNGLVLAAVCVIFYCACHCIAWLWQKEVRDMEDFGKEVDALESRTKAAEKLAVTMDRPDYPVTLSNGMVPGWGDERLTQEEKNRVKIWNETNRLCAEIEGK